MTTHETMRTARSDQPTNRALHGRLVAAGALGARASSAEANGMPIGKRGYSAREGAGVNQKVLIDSVVRSLADAVEYALPTARVLPAFEREGV
jgi:hypothetical protein